MRPFGKLLLLGLLAFSCTVLHGQFAGFRPGRIAGFGWARGTYKLVQNVSIKQMSAIARYNWDLNATRIFHLDRRAKGFKSLSRYAYFIFHGSQGCFSLFKDA